MNDQTWGVLVGALVMFLLRVLDTTLPKGHVFKWTKKYLVKADVETEEEHGS